MASPIEWWVWASSRRWWRTGKPGVLKSMGSQRVRHDWVTERPHWARTLLLSCAGDSPWESASRWPACWVSAEAGPAASPGLETAASPQMAPRGASPGPFFLRSPAWLTQAALWGCGQAASVSSSVQLPQWHSIVPGRGGPRLAAPRPGFQETSAWLLFVSNQQVGLYRFPPVA